MKKFFEVIPLLLRTDKTLIINYRSLVAMPVFLKKKFTRIASRAGSDCIVFWVRCFFFIVFFQSFFGP